MVKLFKIFSKSRLLNKNDLLLDSYNINEYTSKRNFELLNQENTRWYQKVSYLIGEDNGKFLSRI